MAHPPRGCRGRHEQTSSRLPNERCRACRLDPLHQAPTSSGTMSHLPSGHRHRGARRRFRWLIHPVDGEADTSRQARSPECAILGTPTGSVATSTYIVGDDEPPAERTQASRREAAVQVAHPPRGWRSRPEQTSSRLPNERCRACRLDPLQQAPTSSGTMSHLPSGHRHRGARRRFRWLIHPVDVEADTSRQAQDSERAMPGVPAESVAISTYIVGDDEPPAERRPAIAARGGCPGGSSIPWMEKPTRADKLKLPNERRRACRLDPLHQAPTSSGTMSHLTSGHRRRGGRQRFRWLIHPVDVEADTSRQAQDPERAMPGVRAESVAISTYIVGNDEPPGERTQASRREAAVQVAHPPRGCRSRHEQTSSNSRTSVAGRAGWIRSNKHLHRRGR